MYLVNITKFDIEIPASIIPFVYGLKEQDPHHRSRSTKGGWTSKNVKSIPLLLPYACVSAWFCINPPGSYNEWHNHSGIPVSGVIYIQTPQHSGNIVFKNNESTYTIVPYKGLMIQFPGDLDHQVTVNNSKEDRIALVFNSTAYT